MYKKEWGWEGWWALTIQGTNFERFHATVATKGTNCYFCIHHWQMLCRNKVFITSNALSKHSPPVLLKVSGTTNLLQILTYSETPTPQNNLNYQIPKAQLSAAGWSSLVYSIKTTPTHLASLNFSNKMWNNLKCYNMIPIFLADRHFANYLTHRSTLTN